MAKLQGSALCRNPSSPLQLWFFLLQRWIIPIPSPVSWSWGLTKKFRATGTLSSPWSVKLWVQSSPRPGWNHWAPPATRSRRSTWPAGPAIIVRLDEWRPANTPVQNTLPAQISAFSPFLGGGGKEMDWHRVPEAVWLYDTVTLWSKTFSLRRKRTTNVEQIRGWWGHFCLFLVWTSSNYT